MTEKDRVSHFSKRAFKRCDIAVYALIALLIALSFVIRLTSRTNVSGGFAAYIGGEKVLEYDFSDGSYLILDPARVTASEKDKFTFSCGDGINTLTVYQEDGDAVITYADCGGRQCTKMRLSSGSIICAPHDLVIKMTGGVTEPLVG